MPNQCILCMANILMLFSAFPMPSGQAMPTAPLPLQFDFAHYERGRYALGGA
ncbi:hypothetical protein XM38_018620 [Halomicronema hongdechloris C2206]|uniref:Uncharacterized protein n=1 Tax=Halomicronema hongdechloris C2206 TaxID=1641165 RepID=A0A1Z3HKS6_9CYAN|nr:hypothetical protein [Halomicronema hongdechloris]ASC70914.1 hypothetical protein XM38_018620 [Halomicronema hongdechloris C2206]